MHNIKDLETEGFVVIKNFFDKEDIERYKTLFDNIPADKIKSRFYNTKFDRVPLDKKRKIILANFNHDINKKIESILKQVREETNIVVDIVTKIPTFFDNSVFYNGWHQDHEPYYLCQDSYNSLNFWIPIVKPNPKTSGMFILPYSKLPDDLKEMLTGTGARTFVRENDTTIITDNDTGDKFEVDFDIDKHCVVPEVEAGDLILLRVDTLHKTQPATEHRIAMSVRCYNSKSKIYRDRFFSGPEEKKLRMQSHQHRYNGIANKFNQTTDDYILLGDVEIESSLH
jgi:ectoine hydroxylase-related dioxygenase (phytanoyl-CoA dioxygenase family)